jgi:hypothetical protein
MFRLPPAQPGREVTGGEKVVDVGEFLFERGAVSVHEATGEGDFCLRPRLLKSLKRMQFVDNLVLGALTHNTAIQENQVSLLSRGSRLIVEVFQIAGKPLGFHSIHLATYGPDIIIKHVVHSGNLPRLRSEVIAQGI